LVEFPVDSLKVWYGVEGLVSTVVDLVRSYGGSVDEGNVSVKVQTNGGKIEIRRTLVRLNQNVFTAIMVNN